HTRSKRDWSSDVCSSDLECVELCAEIVNEEIQLESNFELEEVPTPKEIQAILDDYIIGQNKAKRSLAVAVYNHYKRIKSGNVIDDVELAKSNIVLIGPTG